MRTFLQGERLKKVVSPMVGQISDPLMQAKDPK
jgi:hypothetical protein